MIRDEISKVVESIERDFPIEGYVAKDPAPYGTVADVVAVHMNAGDRLLDFGSGPCDKTAVASRLGVACTAVDDFGDAWYHEANHMQTIRSWAEQNEIELRSSLDGLEPETFDMVMMNDVLEHLHDSPRPLLEAMIELLKPEGLLFVTVPNLANIRKRISLATGRTNLPAFDLFYYYEGPWRGPVREYVKPDLEAVIDYLSLEMVEIRAIDHMLENLPDRLRLPYLAVTKIFPGWKDTWLLVARRPAGWSRESVPQADFTAIYERQGKQNLHQSQS